MIFRGKNLIASALAIGLSMGLSHQSFAGGGLFGKGASKADQTGQSGQSAHNHNHDHQHAVDHAVAQVGDVTAEGTVISITPVYPPGEEPGKASFDGTRQDSRIAMPSNLMGQAGHVTAEPAPIGVVQTNYNRSGAAAPVGMPRDVMAHGRQAGAPGMMPPGMMPPPGMVPPGQAPGGEIKPPRRGLFSLLRPRKSAEKDPYAVFHMNPAQRSMHAAMPVGPQAQPTVNSLPPSAVYGH
jgi:hypothetical protein